ncbi:MAG: hypothetical protein NWE92_02910 [Candidatus Bathyarchaeota archaeon]|nr:hypothetical protein [Candidatus Bathyarchaeota archaeon]
MRKKLAVFLVSVLIFLYLPLLEVSANPMGAIDPYTIVPAPANADALISLGISSPNENGEYSNGTIHVHFNESIKSLSGITTTLNIITYYQGDWMQSSRWCPFPSGVDPQDNHRYLEYDFYVKDVPVGEHTLNIKASGSGQYSQNGTRYVFGLEKTISLNFTMTASPVEIKRAINFNAPQYSIYENNSFDINFTVNYPTSEMTYSLDNQGNASVTGNLTLNGLSAGKHNVTVYAIDEYDNWVASDSLVFFVIASESAAPLVAAVGIIVVAVVSCLTVLFYDRKTGWKKRKCTPARPNKT